MAHLKKKKFVDPSGMQTRIIREDGELTDHATTTTAQLFY